jgi:GH43 family beta-xylosidase
LKFAENPQIKLDEDPFSANMKMIELNVKKVLVWPSHAESIKGK